MGLRAFHVCGSLEKLASILNCLAVGSVCVRAGSQPLASLETQKRKGMCHCLAEVLHDVVFKTEGPMLSAGCQCDYRMHSCHPGQSGNRDCN